LGAESKRLREILDGLGFMDLPGREHIERHLVGMVRRNFRPLAIGRTLSTLKPFLAFLREPVRIALRR
jgi:hypothetical protein